MLVLIGTLFTFIGFNVADTVLTARGLQGILGWNERAVSMLAAIAAALLAIYGHDWLHRIFRWCFLLCMPFYTLLTLAVLLGRIPAPHPAVGEFTWVALFAQFAASAGYNITYAPSVSDYSRYLPRATRPPAIIAAVFIGAASSAIWLIVLGAWGARGLIAYLAGFAATLPFFVLPDLYTGPAARSFEHAHEAQAIADSERGLKGLAAARDQCV